MIVVTAKGLRRDIKPQEIMIVTPEDIPPLLVN
jgi:hypothetical protein